ncbi:MAG: N-acetyltransferase [Gammaproteobacteria bacterium]|nr:N-acetyltransferase [Gammaproteobacteria bacterium]
MIEIRPVSGRRLLKQFVKVPWSVYRDDPAWVPPLILERLMALSPKEPIFEHLDWQGWIACRGGVPVGRISAQIDALHLKHNDPRQGFFGMIDGMDDADLFASLANTAEEWLRKRGMTSVLGPLNLNINQEPGLLYDGYESPSSFLMGHARPYYHPRLESAGYRSCRELLAYRLAPNYDEPAAIRRLRRRLGARLVLRNLNRADKAAELEVVRRIFNDGWSGNWGFVPFTEAEFAAIGNLLLFVVPKDFILIAELDGEPAGFIVVLPNINECIRDLNGRLFPIGWAKLLWRLKVRLPRTVRVPLMGVRKDLHDTVFGPGIAMTLIHGMNAPTLRHGVIAGELSWILEDNAGMRSILERLGGTVTKRYRLYEKSLGGS